MIWPQANGIAILIDEIAIDLYLRDERDRLLRIRTDGRSTIDPFAGDGLVCADIDMREVTGIGSI